ncbi:hypothetical protein [Kutzneria sp. CA-103260]|uniref:hypothetical protein n=1 Tax=Kutzneria sp. CA-103260 TaxID=2802641 RepID=UPI001BA8F028|nr:hypothetical protein [Kutzneria sp. CA-103260]QUQ71110.1 hypothetical protein JJ691_88930 [Kutzneria sp. CA-103260]
MPGPSLDLYDLTILPEHDEFLVGRPETDDFVVLPADGVALLRRLQDGEEPAAAADWYRLTYGESVDIDDFVDTLRELGFVRTGGETEAVRAEVPLRRLGRWAFSPLAWILYAAVVAAAVASVVAQPRLLPRPESVFFSDSLVLVQVVLAIGQLPGIFLHESLHVLAGRRLGLPTRLGVGRRLVYFVFETTLVGLHGVPRRQRYLPFLAGMVGDLLFTSVLTLIAAADSSWVGRLALALAYSTLLRLAWQFYLFLRTDLYFVFVTALECTDLHGATRALLRNRFSRLLGRTAAPVDESQWTERDRATARWYAPFMLAGYVCVIAVTLFGVIPVFTVFAQRLIGRMGHGLVIDGAFWDAAVSLALVLLQIGLLITVSIRDRRRRALVPA